jgi:hypothetical protein
MTTTHEQFQMHNPIFDQYIMVDKGLVELLRLIWDKGICTIHSCQGGEIVDYEVEKDENNHKFAYIMFLDPESVKIFLDLIAEYPEINNDPSFQNTLYARILGAEYDAPNKWVYEVHPRNLGVEQTIVNNEVLECYKRKNEFVLHMIIRFPHTDIPLIVDAIKRKKKEVENSPFTF